MQLILNIPLLGLQVPPNVRDFSKFIFETLNFQIIPTEWLFNSVKYAEGSLNSELSDEFYTMGFKSTNFLQNIGTYLIVAVIGILAFAGLFCLSYIVIKYPKAR